MDPGLGDRQEGDCEKCGVQVRSKGKMELRVTAPLGPVVPDWVGG